MICLVRLAYYHFIYVLIQTFIFLAKALVTLEQFLITNLIKSVAEWTKCNRLGLTVSVSKNNFILFHSYKLKPKKSSSIKIVDVCNEQVDSTK